jgi:2'-5' RNA ligase
MGEEFKAWPPHITIVPWFRSDMTTKQVAAELESELAEIFPFEVEAGEELPFGNRKKPANVITLPSPLTKAESIIRSYLKSHGAWLVDESTRRRSKFRPHITVQPTGRVKEGQIVKIKRLYVVAQCGDFKQIEEVIKL